MGYVAGPVYITENPTKIIARCLSNDSRQGFAFGVIVHNKKLYNCFKGSVNIGQCCCNNKPQEYVQTKICERNIKLSVKDLIITISGTIGGQPFTGKVIGVYSGIPASPIIYFSDIISLGKVSGSSFIPNLGFPSAFNFVEEVCLPTRKNMSINQCLDACLSVDCVRPVNEVYSVLTDPTNEQVPKGNYACFLANMDLSLLINKCIYFLTKEKLPVLSSDYIPKPESNNGITDD